VGKPEGKRSLGRRGYRKKDNIKIDLKGMEWDGLGWIHLAQDRDKCKHSNEASVYVKVLIFVDQIRKDWLL
jgi:hypothetical protein